MSEYNKNAILTYSIDSQRRKIDFSKEIAELVPDESPFAVILMKARKLVASTSEYKWYDQEPGAWWTKSTPGATSGATSITVDDSSVFSPKDIIKVSATDEVMFVVSITDATTIVVTRGYGTTAAAAIPAGGWLMRMGNALEENSNSPESKSKQPSKFNNYTQIFRTPFDQSMTSEAEDLVTVEAERTRLRRQKLIEHRLDIERAMIWGEGKEDVAGKRRMTKGLINHITSNVTNLGSTLDLPKWEAFCEKALKWGSKTKLFICSPNVGSQINGFAAGKIQTKSGEDTYGIHLKEYVSFHGRVMIATSYTFEKDYAGMGLMLDMDNIYYRPLKGRDTKLRTNIQAPDLDGWRDEYLTEAGLMVRLEKTHALLKGVTLV